MGTFLRFNDTLMITTAEGFPADVLDLARHRENPIMLDQLKDRIFAFHGKPHARFFHLEPTRVYLAHSFDGESVYWGHIFIQSQTIAKTLDADGQWTGEWNTSGTYRIVDIYEPEYQEVFSAREARVK